MINKHALKNIPHRWIVIGLTVLYAAFVVWVSSLHEVWRDEVVCLSIAAQSHSIGELLNNAHNFGHPPLWYVLLYFGYQLFPHFVILKILNLLICILAAYLFFSKSPFSWFQKILFMAGYFPLYFYPVINRNYGISFLLVVLVCIFYKDRWKKIIPLGIVLGLMANAHAHYLIVALAVMISMAYEMLFSLKDVRRKLFCRDTFIGLGAAIGGIIFSISQIRTDHTSVIFSEDSITLFRVIRGLTKALVFPGKYFSSIFVFDNAIFVNLIILAVYIYLFRKTNLFVLFLAGVCGLSLFFELIYFSTELRHQSSLYLFIFMIFWMDAQTPADHNKLRIKQIYNLSARLAVYKNQFFILLLITQAFMAYPAVKADIFRPYSAGKQLADLIRSNPQWHDAIVTGEPEHNQETLSYYLPNQLFIYSENKFGLYRQLSDVGKRTVALSDFLEKAEELKNTYHKPVIILLGDQIRPEGPYQFSFTHHSKMFEFTRADLEAFYKRTVLLAEFSDSISDEKYSVYLLN